MADTALGPIVTGDDVCVAVEQTLALWLPSTLTVLNTGRDATAALQPLVRVEQLPDPQAMRADVTPVASISTPGIKGAPVRDGRGASRASWTVTVAVLDRDDTYAQVASRCRRWAAAVRTAVGQHPALGGLATDTEWVGEDYARVNSGSSATLGMALVTFDVHVSSVFNRFGGPTTPPAAGVLPPAALTVQSVDLTANPSR